MTKPPHDPLENNLSPLKDLEDDASGSGPVVEWMTPDSIPEPLRRLLEHPNDMTSTLEKYHGGEIVLKILALHENGDTLKRKVLLQVESSGKTVEYGAIRIILDRFPQEARNLITGCRIPLGSIMDKFNLPHQNSPTRYFRILADPQITLHLNIADNYWLYGRCNTITDDEGSTMAEVVEILPPLDGEDLPDS
jgi:chorismate-pyruvate lyase